MRPAVAKWLLAVLVTANALVIVTWWSKSHLPTPAPDPIEFPSRPLPRIVPPAPPKATAEQTAPPATAPAPVPETTVSSVPQPISRACFGPFKDRAASEDMLRRVEAAGGSAELEERHVDAPPLYLVYVQPAATRDMAERTALALGARSVETYVIPSGERENGVSVGVFSTRDLAAAQQRRIAELGYRVLVQTRQRTATAYLVRAVDVPVEALAPRKPSPPSAAFRPSPSLPITPSDFAADAAKSDGLLADAPRVDCPGGDIDGA